LKSLLFELILLMQKIGISRLKEKAGHLPGAFEALRHDECVVKPGERESKTLAREREIILFFIYIIYLGLPPARLAGEGLTFLCGGCQASSHLPYFQQTKEKNKKTKTRREKKKRENNTEKQSPTVADVAGYRRTGTHRPRDRAPPPEGRR
jgi:hypothetical protein